jgi:hypothetical protein
VEPVRSRWTRLLLSLALLGAAGCVGYAESTRAARGAYYAGDYPRAEQLLSELLAGEGREKDGPLLLLERAMVHLAAGRYEAAARDLLAADEQLEVMDFTSDPEQIGRYLFSEDSGLYRGPPHEKILIPTLNSIALAALGDLPRAKTAANAAYSQVVRFEELRPDLRFPSPLALILVGIAAELDGDTQRAFSAFRQAYELRPIRSLEPVLGRLLAENARSFGGHWVRDYQQRPAAWQEPPPVAEDQGELIVVVLNGKAPVREASELRMTQQQRAEFVAMSMTSLATENPEVDMVEAQARFEQQSLLPMAVLQPRPSRYSGGAVEVPGQGSFELENVLPVGEQVADWYRANEGTMLAAALSRLAVKVAARVGTYLATKKQTGDELMAWIASSLAGAALDAVDTPDTRCWALLPDEVLFQRRTVPAGTVALTLRLAGSGGDWSVTRTVEVAPGGLAFVVEVVPD